MEEHEKQTYVLPPPMAGFFEFSLMRIRGDIDQKTLSELFHQYLSVEDDFIKDLFREGDLERVGTVFDQTWSCPSCWYRGVSGFACCRLRSKAG
jgi:hypothetical protein